MLMDLDLNGWLQIGKANNKIIIVQHRVAIGWSILNCSLEVVFG
jgi:hypothetical protein